MERVQDGDAVVKRMNSREIRDHWRDVLDHVRAGNEVVVMHYHKPIARIVPEETTMAAIITREAILAWLGDGHGLTDEGVSELVERAAEIGDRWPNSFDVGHRMDRLWWAYQNIVTAAAPSKEAALDIIHGKTRTGVDPWTHVGDPVID